MIKAYSYVRFSRPEQLRGDSLRRQTEASAAYAAANGLTLDESMQDLGLSAFSGAHRERGALGAFLALVQAKKVPPGSVLIVESLDRLSREAVLEALEQFTALINGGIEIVTLVDNQRYSRELIGGDWTKLIISLTVMSRAHEESAIKSKRLAAAWEKKRRDGQNKVLTAQCPAWLHVDGGRFVIIEERARIITRIFRETADGLGKRAIAIRLNRDGIQNWGRGATGWQPSYVSKLLQSEAVIGHFQPCKKIKGRRIPEGQAILGYFPEVVPQDLYWRAKAATAARRTSSEEPHGKKAYSLLGGRRGAEFNNLFSGLGKCARCGGAMAFYDKGPPPKGGRYLGCDRARRGLGCSNARMWRYDHAEHVVLTGLTRADLGRVLQPSDEGDNGVDEVEIIRAKLGAVESTEQKMAEAFEGAPTKRGAERLRQLESEIENLRTQLRDAEAARKEASAISGDLPARIAGLEALRQQMKNLELDELYRLRARLAQELRRVLRRLEFTEDNILAFYKIPSPLGGRSRLALPDSAGHHLILDGTESGDGVEIYIDQLKSGALGRRPRHPGRDTPH